VRSIKSRGKTRPGWFSSKLNFVTRFKILTGILKPTSSEQILGGVAEAYEVLGVPFWALVKVQNDGKLLSLLRLNALRNVWYLKPFVRYCKSLYIKRYGPRFQSIMVANYFEESMHPVRLAFGALDDVGKTVIDC